MVSLTSAKVAWMPHDASLIVLLVTIFLPVDPLSLTVTAAKVLVIVLVCTTAPVSSVKVTPSLRKAPSAHGVRR